MITQTYTGTLTVIECCNCHADFGMTQEMYQARRRDHDWFYCPVGHVQHFKGKSDVEAQRERAEKAEQRAAWANSRAERIQGEREAAERQARAYKGHVTRLRNRIAAGVCPVQSCRRNFANVKAHVESQHPDWAHDHPEALA